MGGRARYGNVGDQRGTIHFPQLNSCHIQLLALEMFHARQFLSRNGDGNVQKVNKKWMVDVADQQAVKLNGDQNMKGAQAKSFF